MEELKLTSIEAFVNAANPVVPALEVPSALQPVGCTLDAAFHAAMAAFNATKAVDYQVAAKFARVAVQHGGFTAADRNLSAASEDLSSEELLAVRSTLV